MQNTPMVSIIIATYRREDELLRALYSVAVSKYKNYEIVLVDDNDEPEWNEKVKKIVGMFKSKYPEIRFTCFENHPNMGSAKTRNRGIECSKGDYICFLDDDDVYLPERILSQLEPMIKADSDYSLTDLALYNENDKMVKIRTREYIKDTSKDSLFRYHLMYHMTGTDTLMFKKEYLDSIGGFDPIDIGDEFYLMSKAILQGGKFLYVPVSEVKAYVHQSGGLSSGEGKLMGEMMLYEYKKKYFPELKKDIIRHIKVRHHAVMALASYKNGKYLDCILEVLKAGLTDPIKCVGLLR